MRGFRRRRRLWRDKAEGEEKNHIKRRVERQKVFSSPPAINQSSFITQPTQICSMAILYSVQYFLALALLTQT